MAHAQGEGLVSALERVRALLVARRPSPRLNYEPRGGGSRIRLRTRASRLVSDSAADLGVAAECAQTARR